MKRTLLLIIVLFYAALSASKTAVAVEVPTVNIPKNLRESNFYGNCVHASFVNLLRWQGQYHCADWWIKNHGGGEYPGSMKQQLDASGIDYAMTFGRNDVAFLERSIATHRGCAVAVSNGPLYGYGGRISHMICLVHMDKDVVGIIDNNHGNRLMYVDREAFLRDWSNSSWALLPLMGTPAPPQLWRTYEKHNADRNSCEHVCSRNNCCYR